MPPVAQVKLIFDDRTILPPAMSPMAANTTIRYALHHTPDRLDYVPFYSSNGQMPALTRDMVGIISKNALL